MDKISPYQYEFPTFSSTNGNLSFSVGETSVDIDLSTDLTGTFNFIGSLLYNTGTILSSHSSNNFGGIATSIMGGQSNFATGSRNSIVNSYLSKVSGLSNCDINGYSTEIDNGASFSTAICGRNINILHDGVAVIKDMDNSSSITSTQDNSFLSTFLNGYTLIGAVHARTSFHGAGAFRNTGSADFYGTVKKNGANLATEAYVTGRGSVLGENIKSTGYVPSSYTDTAGRSGDISVAPPWLYVQTGGGWGRVDLSW